MRSNLRKTGISLIGELPWGSHFCQFYQGTEDLRDILIPFFRAGLENNEFCLWITTGAPGEEGALKALQEGVPDFVSCADRGQMQIIPCIRWSAMDGESGSAVGAMLDRATSGGCDGLRLACIVPPGEDGSRALAGYRAEDIGSNNALAVFAYPRDDFDALGLMEVVRNHRFALVRNAGTWEVIESSEARILREELKKSEELYRSLFENMLNGFAYCRMLSEGDCPTDFTFLTVNGAFEKLTGLQDVVGKRVSEVIPGIRESNAALFDTFGRVARTGVPERFDAYVDALKMWFSIAVYRPKRDHFVAVFDVITERKQAEQEISKLNEELKRNIAELSSANASSRDARRAALNMMEDALLARRQAEEANAELKRSEEQFRTLADAIPQLCWMANADGWIFWYNRRWYEYTGTSAEQMEGWGWQSVHDPQVLPAVVERWQASISTGKPFDMVFPLRGADGVFRPFLTRVLPVYDHAGNVDRWFGTNTDISEQRRAEEALHHSNARLDLLAETASQLLASDSPQKIVEGLCRKVMAHLDCHAFFNLLVDDEQNRLHLNACAGIPEEEARRIEWLDYGTAVCGCAARDACRIVAEDIQNTPDPLTELVKSYGFQAYACHPLMSQAKVIGTLSFGTRTRIGFSDDDLSLMKAVADQVAIAMERKNSAEVLQKAHDELEARVRERTEELTGTVETLLGEIAERERTEAQLCESEKKFRSLFEESKDMIYLMDADDRLIDVNPAGIELLGYTKEEVATLDFTSELYSEPTDRERFLRLLYMDGFVRNFETRMQRKDGETLYVLKTASVTRSEGGEITGYRGIVHDISERKRLEQQLLQAQKMESIGLLAGGVAHDFNNLMTAVTGYGQLIRENIDPANELLTMCAEQLLGAAERATELTRNLLAFGRKQIINPKPVPVNEIIINVTKLLTRIIGEDIEFQTNLTSTPLMVMADRGQIDQVLVNLVANARDAMPDGGKLCIGTLHRELDERAARRCELEKPGAYAIITVADTGTGMDERTRERIFEPFFTTKEPGKGTGLGLSIIYGIVKQHNGAIFAESEPGKGTTFTIYLPVVRDAVAEARKAAVLPAYGTETILLAEDDSMVRHFMEEMLKLAGFTVIAATNGEEAISLFRRHRDKISLVVSDVVMPRKNGKEVFDEITGMAPGMKFIFTSGYTDDIIHKKGLLDESLDFLLKPVGKNDLLQKVREVLDR